MKKLKKGQWGFTLLELVIVIGLTGLIAGGLTLMIMRVFNMDARTRDDMIAVYQVRQAGKLVSQDILEAQIVNPNNATGSNGFPLILTRTVGATNYAVNYTLADMSGGLKILWRKHYTNSVLDSTTKVAEYISYPAGTSCAWAGGVLTFTVTATVGGQNETRVYEVKPRPGT